MDESERVLARLQRIDDRRGDAGAGGRPSPELLGELRALVAEAEALVREETRKGVEGMR